MRTFIDVKHYLKETHCTHRKEKLISYGWQGKIFHSLSDNASSRGVTILFGKHFSVKVLSKFNDKEGRLIMVNVEFEDQVLSLVSLYAPNKEKNRIAFYNYAKRWINEKTLNINNLYVAGDFNGYLRICDKATENVLLDRSRQSLIDLIESLNLKDIHQIKNGKTALAYTYERGDKYKSRIDYIFTSNKNVEVKNCTTKYLVSGSRKHSLSDHKAVYVELAKQANQKGSGYWKINNNLLKNQDFVLAIQNLLRGQLKRFKCCPSKLLFWEKLKLCIKDISLQFSKEITYTCQSKIRKIENKITNISNSNIEDSLKTQQLDLLYTELDDLYSVKADGAKVRSRFKWWEMGEKSNSYFLRLEKEHQTNNTITQLETNGRIISDNNQLLNKIHSFYQTLFKSDGIKSEIIDRYLNDIKVESVLTEEDASLCEGKITKEECNIIVSELKSNKSPGLDGISQEFYKFFWDDLSEYFMSVVNEIYDKGEMCHSMEKSVLSLIYKKNDKKCLNNYRPISITNTDYKILAFVLARRVQKVLRKIISHDQTAYIKGRYIGNNCRYVIDIIDYCNRFNREGLICFLDYSKASDSLHHYFIRACLEKFKFGHDFLRWIDILYHNPTIVVKNNGWLTSPLHMKKGIRQGCPISAMLFIIATEILTIQIKNCNDVQGIKLLNGVKCSPFLQYADVGALPLDGCNSLQNALNIISNFGDVSGLKLNLNKTEIILLGPLEKSYNSDNLLGIRVNRTHFKYLGIMVGNNLKACFHQHWQNQIMEVKNLINSWKQRQLSIKGKIIIIKSLIIPKITLSLSLIPLDKQTCFTLKRLLFKFIWKTTERIKRKTLIGDYQDGGMKMVDIELYEKSLKASWIQKLFGKQNYVNPIAKYYLDKICKNHLLLLHGNFDMKSLKILNNIPTFYSEVLCNFSYCLGKENIMEMSTTNFLKQQIWFNSLFLYKGQCLKMDNWIESNIIFVKDLYDDKGNFITENTLLEKLHRKENWICEFVIIYAVFKGYDQIFDCTKAKYCNSKLFNAFTLNKKQYDINLLNTKLFHSIYVNKNFVRPISERRWCKKFNFEYKSYSFQQIYIKKVKHPKISKFAEFNYKLLHNMLITNEGVNKWNKDISKDCEYCLEIEDIEHKIFNCKLVKPIWNKF